MPDPPTRCLVPAPAGSFPIGSSSRVPRCWHRQGTGHHLLQGGSPEPGAVRRPEARSRQRNHKLEPAFCTVVGGEISPLLANIALHGMEDVAAGSYRRRDGGSTVSPTLVRYADDVRHITHR